MSSDSQQTNSGMQTPQGFCIAKQTGEFKRFHGGFAEAEFVCKSDENSDSRRRSCVTHRVFHSEMMEV